MLVDISGIQFKVNLCVVVGMVITRYDSKNEKVEKNYATAFSVNQHIKFNSKILFNFRVTLTGNTHLWETQRNLFLTPVVCLILQVEFLRNNKST